MKSTHFFSVTVALLCLLVLDYSSAWTAPSGNPPANNVAAPVHTGSAAQVKVGPLSVDGLTVFGNSLIESSGPRIEFSDADVGDTDWLIQSNAERMYFMNDRNDDGFWTGEAPWPLILKASTTNTTEADYARINGQVQASEYCDADGSNCVSASTLTSNTYECVSAYGATSGSGGGPLSVTQSTLGVTYPASDVAANTSVAGNDAPRVTCNIANDWVMTGCSYKSIESQDQDVIMGVNECIGDDDGNNRETYARCCRLN